MNKHIYENLKLFTKIKILSRWTCGTTSSKLSTIVSFSFISHGSRWYVAGFGSTSSPVHTELYIYINTMSPIQKFEYSRLLYMFNFFLSFLVVIKIFTSVFSCFFNQCFQSLYNLISCRIVYIRAWQMRILKMRNQTDWHKVHKIIFTSSHLH